MSTTRRGSKKTIESWKEYGILKSSNVYSLQVPISAKALIVVPLESVDPEKVIVIILEKQDS